MAYEQILYDVADGVATVTMNRPDRMNAMTPVMNGEIRAAMQAASDDTAVKAIVLTGAGRGFCAGADVARLSNTAAGGAREAEPLPVDGAIEGGIDLPAGYAAKYAWMTTVPKPVIAAVNGAAVGVGLVMALYSDYRICAAEAKLGTAFARRGLVAEYGLAWLLPRIVGPSKALDLLYSARLVKGDEAERMGLVDRAVPAGDVLGEAQAYAKMLAEEVSPRSTRVIKGLVWRSLIQSMDEAQDDSLAEMQTALKSDDFKEGIAAWQEKRAPRFTGG
ncbi:MAG: enoyl-CoA hydratase-related protein [Minwuia sp.]|uniref:enoyl-CoA hydratase-related protein n=1 Tax=Minwuia sp. TaxID=2493630 RepID=UPI003A88EAF7